MEKWGKCLIFIFGVLELCWHVSGKNKYDNYTLIKITPNNVQHLNALRKLSAIVSKEVSVLKRSRGLNDTTDILVSPTKRAAVGKLAVRHGMSFKFINHYGRVFDREAKYLRISRSSDDFDVYHFNSYNAIQKHIRFLAKKYSKLVTLQALGKSYEGREMRLVKISANPRYHNPVIFIDAGVHAREWVAPALTLYLIERLATSGRDLGGVDWYILPLTNPDGYEYTRKDQSNRMWRQSRSNTKKDGCIGVDINRNYGFKWGVSGVSFDPCDNEIYAGPYAFSETESRIVKKVMTMYSKRIKLYATLHAYGQYLVYPWSYTGDTLPPTWKKLHRFAKLFSDAVEKAGGEPFTIMSSGQWYASAGASDDYAFGAIKIPYAYTLEITDGYEFTFPAKLLRTVLPQYYEGFKTFASGIAKEFGENILKHSKKDTIHKLIGQSSQCGLAGR